MDETKLRAWWSCRQGLDGRLEGGSAAEVLAKTGWARSVGSAGPYLTLFARAGLGRPAADAAVARLQIHELPGARGCTYVVPSPDYALALKVGQDFFAVMKTALKLGVGAAEIDRLCGAVVDVLAHGPLDPEEIRRAVGGAARNLGEPGKMKGLVTTLPVALGRLQSMGEIRRIPLNGRLDQQRYRYALWRPNPLDGCRLSGIQAYTELARRFFDWAGPATVAEFQWFSGLGVKAARMAIEPLQLVPLAAGSDRLMSPEDFAQFQSYGIPGEPHVVLVSSLDGISHLRRDVESLLAPEDRRHSLLFGKGLMDLNSHAILDRGRLVGLWEYDTAAGEIVWLPFVPKSRALQAAVDRTEAFIREELGDARSFSLDSPKSRQPRIDALRKAARH